MTEKQKEFVKPYVVDLNSTRQIQGMIPMWENGQSGNPKGRPQCGARTRAGGTCKAKVVAGKSKCRMHGGLSTGPRTPKGRAAIVASNKRRALEKGVIVC